MKVRDVVRISNVENISAYKKPRRKGGKKNQVSVVQVHRAVWEKALELSHGNRSRIEVLSETEVRVKN